MSGEPNKLFLSDDQLAVQEAIRRFYDERIAPHAKAIDESDEFPHDIFRALGELGYMGMTSPPEFGGTQLDLVSQVIVPIGICTLFSSLRPLQSGDIWLAIVCGHFTRATLSVLRFRQGAWREIKVTAPA